MDARLCRAVRSQRQVNDLAIINAFWRATRGYRLRHYPHVSFRPSAATEESSLQPSEACYLLGSGPILCRQGGACALQNYNTNSTRNQILQSQRSFRMTCICE